MGRVTRDTSHDPTHGLVRPRGRRRMLEDEQACSSLTRSPLSSVVLLCPCLFLWHLAGGGGCAALSYVYANSGTGCVAATLAVCLVSLFVSVCCSCVSSSSVQRPPIPRWGVQSEPDCSSPSYIHTYR